MIFEIKKLAREIDKHMMGHETKYVVPSSVLGVLYSLEQMGYSVEPKFDSDWNVWKNTKPGEGKAMGAFAKSKAEKEPRSIRTEWMIQGHHKDGKWLDLLNHPLNEKEARETYNDYMDVLDMSSWVGLRIVRREIREWEVED